MSVLTLLLWIFLAWLAAAAVFAPLVGRMLRDAARSRQAAPAAQQVPALQIPSPRRGGTQDASAERQES